MYGVGGEEVAAREGDFECGWDCFIASSAAEGENSGPTCVEYVVAVGR